MLLCPSPRACPHSPRRRRRRRRCRRLAMYQTVRCPQFTIVAGAGLEWAVTTSIPRHTSLSGGPIGDHVQTSRPCPTVPATESSGTTCGPAGLPQGPTLGAARPPPAYHRDLYSVPHERQEAQTMNKTGGGCVWKVVTITSVKLTDQQRHVDRSATSG